MAGVLQDALALPILIVLAVALLVFALVVWLIVRARRPSASPTLTEAVALGAGGVNGWRNRMRALWREVSATLHCLTTRREWRYATPWLLMCGEDNAGKTSLALSLHDSRRQRLTPREERLPFAGTTWNFFARGVLIDVNGTPAPSREERGNWQEMLRGLNELRPERALDGVVVALSARTLRTGSSAQLQQFADDCQRQLWELQQRFEFSLPVYVVVTQCDAVDGFGAFWSAQPPARRREIFGWSSPYALAHQFVPEWIDDAFSEMACSLKTLQLQASAADREIDRVDDFFLFPQRFGELKTPLRSVLATLFRASAYEAGAFCRGVYFVGSIDADGAAAQTPRDDVAFAENLFDEKIFAELNLARPTRQGVWSRHRLIRRVQYATLGVFAGLCVALAQAALALHDQIDAAVASFELIEARPSSSAACVGAETVYELLGNVARLNVRLSYAAIPASWVDRRVSNKAVTLIADTAFEAVIIPSLACHLERRAAALTTDDVSAASSGEIGAEQRRLRDYLERVLAFERNLTNFNRIVKYSSHDQSSALLERLEELALYLYDRPLPAIVERDGEHRHALTKIEYRRPLSLPADLRADAALRLTQLVEQARLDVDRDIDSGKALLDALNREQPPILANAQRFDGWLKRARADWLGSSTASNPCARMQTWLQEQLRALREFGYHAALLDLARVFDADACYQPAMRRLAQLHVAPHGTLFRHGAAGWELAPSLAKEADGLKALLRVNYMTLAADEAFACDQPLRGWRAPELAEANGFIREYREFMKAHGADRIGGASPLYLRLARRQLRAVLDGVLTRAQARAGYGEARAVAVDALSGADQELTQQSGEFARVVEPLLWTLRAHQELGDAGGSARIAQCVRRYALQSLQTLQALAQTSRLYEPVMDYAGEDDGAPYFMLGDAAQTKDYLDRQLQRAQVLAASATPFVTFLKNTEGGADASATVENSASYWENTVQEVNRFVQFKVPNAQAALLHDLFLKHLIKLTPENCETLLAGVEPAGYGNDLFSRRRRSLERQAEWRCHDRSRALAYQQYEGLAHQFANDLAGRFPFGSLHNGEAPLAQTRQFFLDYLKQRAAIRARLADGKIKGAEDAVLFLERLDEAATFFGSNIAAADGAQPMRVKLEFRALPDQSIGAENVVSWRFATDGAVASHPNGKIEIDWRAGKRVALELAWAELAPVVPQTDTRQPDMRVDGAVAAFEADGPWALLKFIQRHTPPQGPRFDALDPNMMLLEFRVPVTDKRAADSAPRESRLFVGVRFLAVDPKTQAVTALKPPRSFPYYAPSAWQ